MLGQRMQAEKASLLGTVVHTSNYSEISTYKSSLVLIPQNFVGSWLKCPTACSRYPLHLSFAIPETVSLIIPLAYLIVLSPFHLQDFSTFELALQGNCSE